MPDGRKPHPGAQRRRDRAFVVLGRADVHGQPSRCQSGYGDHPGHSPRQDHSAGRHRTGHLSDRSRILRHPGHGGRRGGLRIGHRRESGRMVRHIARLEGRRRQTRPAQPLGNEFHPAAGAAVRRPQGRTRIGGVRRHETRGQGGIRPPLRQPEQRQHGRLLPDDARQFRQRLDDLPVGVESQCVRAEHRTADPADRNRTNLPRQARDPQPGNVRMLDRRSQGPRIRQQLHPAAIRPCGARPQKRRGDCEGDQCRRCPDAGEVRLPQRRVRTAGQTDLPVGRFEIRREHLRGAQPDRARGGGFQPRIAADGGHVPPAIHDRSAAETENTHRQ